VRWVQNSLNQVLGLQLPVSGVMNPETRCALRRFQKDHRLPEDGIAGPETEKALIEAKTQSNPQTEDSPSASELFDEFDSEYDWEDEYNGSPGAGAAFNGLTPVPGIDKTSEAFRLRVIDIARNLGTDPNFLMAIMSFESGLDPKARNSSSGATGLIQFMPSTATRLRTTTDALSRMTAEQQLDYVARYFATYKGRLKTLEDAYMAVLWPKAIGQGSNYVLFSKPEIAYDQNRALDLNKDGRITVAEATSFVRKRLGSKAPLLSGNTTTPSTAPVGGSQLRKRIVQIALQERKRWRDGALKQTDIAAHDILVDYWRTGVRLSASRAALFTNKHKFWSAAFICWVLRKAGVSSNAFRYSSYHSNFFSAAYNHARKNAPNAFKAYSTTQVAPRLGDLICTTYPFNRVRPPAELSQVRANTSGYHSNIVVGIAPGELTVIGGNLSGSVKHNQVKIDATGKVTDPKYFAVLRIG